MKILAKYHSGLDVLGDGVNWNFTPLNIVGSNGGWIKLAPTLWASETYFDLAGLSMDDKTIFPSGITCQQGSTYRLTDGNAGDSILVFDVLTSIPIDISTTSPDLSNWTNVGAGFPGSTLNWEHVLYARTQRWTLDLDTAGGFPLKADEWQSGSMSPTASDRVYSYRVIVLAPLAGSNLSRVVTASARHVMEVDVKAEPEYEYLMRLKRSYDLQQQPDVD